ncbi:MAG TPA: hypothetical protein VFV92_03040, partial [Candidatus Bathyarchaeia archaeon]|nr:hypothetical protein [Candidatus Bathyarchaeia archaeon]
MKLRVRRFTFIRKKPRQFALTALVLMVMVVGSSVAYVQGITMGSQLSVNFVTTSVTGPLNVNSPGSDS